MVVGAGLAGLVAALELAEQGKRVLILDQEPEQSLGGQAFWSFGGLFFVDSPEQRRMGIRDSHELAWSDWLATAGFDRREDHWPRRWAEAYVEWAAGGKREWIRSRGVGFFPVVGWAERGGYGAGGPGNTVPRFHLVWGTGPALVEAFRSRLMEAAREGRVEFRFRHRVSALEVEGGAVVGVRGERLAEDSSPRGKATNREVAGDFHLRAQAVVITTGGIGANDGLVRRSWPTARIGPPPAAMLSGVPAHVDGEMLAVVEGAGGRLINRDRMWHYTEGIRNWDPIWPRHGIRILPGPSSLWLDAEGRRLPPPLFPGFDTLGTLEHILGTGHSHSWFILTRKVIEKEFALSGSEQNPDLTGKSLRKLLGRLGSGAPGPVEAFLKHGADFIVRDRLDDLVRGMNELDGSDRLSGEGVARVVAERDREVENPFGKDAQWNAIHRARMYRGDRLLRTARPHRLLDSGAGPLIAVKLHILTRKTLGGIETNLEGQVLDGGGSPISGLFAAGEAAGFGGGGMHGYRSLEGTFLGGCLFSGRAAAKGVAASVV